MEPQQQNSTLATLIQALIAVAALAWAIWEETPAWQRELIRERVRLIARRTSARAARRSGEQAMADELHGHRTIAELRYRITRKLSEIRDLI
jgi:hypothetical protein